MLALFLIIALTNFDIIRGVDNDSTFINSLPEKQKKEFLQKVEKRIQNEVPEVQPPEGNDKNVDLYEKRLEDQSKTIQNILRSEIDNLKSSQRRDANNTVRQAHIDLTLRTKNKETEARRENEEHTNKNVLLDKIPVVVQYNSENVTNEKSNLSNKKDSKPDVITWINTSQIMKKVDISNTSAERKRTGRRSNDFEMNNVTLRNTNVNSNTGVVHDTTAGKINTKSQEVLTTKDAVEFPVSSESPVTQDVASDTTRQQVSTQADDDNGRTTHGNNNTLTDDLYGKKLDYVSSTQNNADISSTKFNDKDSSLTSEKFATKADDLVNPTAEYYDESQTGNALTTTTQHYVNPQIHNVDISTSLDNLDNSTVLDNFMVTTDATNRNEAVINTNVTVDIVDSTILNNVSTTSYNIHSKTNKSTEADFEMKNNYTDSTKIHNIITEINPRNSVPTYDPNYVTSDDGRHPKYVPIYNYDPENAYFHPTTGRPSDDNVVVQLNSSNPIFIKKTETRAKTTKLDIYENGNKKSLRIKDIKQRVTSASNTNIKSNSDLYDTISGNDSVEFLNDDAYEKPLKHSLKKIREKLYEHQINDKPKDNEHGSDINQGDINQYKNEVRKKYSTNTDEGKSISKLFSKFGTLLQNLLDQENNDEISSSETKRESNEDLRSNSELYRDITLSLENHNRAIKNKGIQQIVETLEKIQNKLHKTRHHRTHDKQKGHQSRFQVQNRDGKQKDKDEIAGFLDYFDKPHVTDEDEFEQEDVIENTKGMKTKDDYLEIHANIVKDLVDVDDEGLQTYDWLGTTVLIQAGLAKIQDVAERKIRHKKLHYLDEKLLEFFMKLHESAIQLVAEQGNERLPTEIKRLSFRIPKFKRGKYFNALKRMYGEMKKTKTISLIRSRYTVEDFRDFLMSLRTSLNGLHTAIKQISFITTYKRQRWFKNIKELYLNSAGKKEYLELLLHFVSARLVGLIDERAKKIVREEEDLTKRDIEADRIEVEFVMAVKICNELTRLND